MTQSQLDALTQINLNDLVSSFGWENYPLLASILRRLFIRFARDTKEVIIERMYGLIQSKPTGDGASAL